MGWVASLVLAILTVQSVAISLDLYWVVLLDGYTWEVAAALCTGVALVPCMAEWVAPLVPLLKGGIGCPRHP